MKSGKRSKRQSNRKQPSRHGQNKQVIQRSSERKAGQDNISAWTVNQSTELFPFLLDTIRNKSRNNIKSILARGQVTVDGKPASRHDQTLAPGQVVAVNWERQAESEPLPGLTILHEDEDIIVVHKEAGLLSIASPGEQIETAYRYLTEYVQSRSPRSRIFIVHRLDRDTSGVMIFAKHEEAKQRLQQAWKEAVPERVYYAVVAGIVKKDEDTIRSWLKETKTLRMYSSPVPNGGQEAITHYKVLQRSQQYSLLEIRLETGRKNQIRVHMEAIGHHVVGDKKYGSRNNPLGRLGLHAGKIAFIHPRTGELMQFSSPLPRSFKRLFQPNKSSP